ncbi:hypothetical protein Ancab_029383 [Ancistrocladus abbreviatus]
MSKRLLSLIKPLQQTKPKSSAIPTADRNTKRLANEVCEILRSYEHWDEALEIRFYEEEEPIDASVVAHLVFDRIRDVELGIKFYDWMTQRKFCSSLDGKRKRIKMQNSVCQKCEYLEYAYFNICVQLLAASLLWQ